MQSIGCYNSVDRIYQYPGVNSCLLLADTPLNPSVNATKIAFKLDDAIQQTSSMYALSVDGKTFNFANNGVYNITCHVNIAFPPNADPNYVALILQYAGSGILSNTTLDTKSVSVPPIAEGGQSVIQIGVSYTGYFTKGSGFSILVSTSQSTKAIAVTKDDTRVWINGID